MHYKAPAGNEKSLEIKSFEIFSPQVRFVCNQKVLIQYAQEVLTQVSFFDGPKMARIRIHIRSEHFDTKSQYYLIFTMNIHK